ncbi:MAG: DMT family transporter [Chitinophagales bacterium]|nr:DMT family transporter [Chitinophagales bacterium]MCZ2394263.1 DMT family transporter [Chitinophagales bacterium]
MSQGKIVGNWLLLVGLSMMWGFSFFFMKKGLDAFSPVEVGALRVFIAFCTLCPFIIFFHKKMPLKVFVYTALAGLLGSGIPPMLFSFAQQHISTSVAGILNTTTPLFALIFGVLFFKVPTKWAQLIGVIIGIIGAITIILYTGNVELKFEAKYSLLVVLASSCYGLSGNILKSKVMQYDIHPIQISILGFLFMGPIAGIFLLKNGTFNRIMVEDLAQEKLKYLLILGVFGTAIAMFFFNWMVQRTSALFASFTTYLIPFFAILIGMIFLKERLNIQQVTGFVIILIGVIVANKKVEDIQ